MADNNDRKSQSWFKVDDSSCEPFPKDFDIGSSGSGVIDTSFLRDIKILIFLTEAERQIDIWRRGHYKTKSLVALSKIIKLNNCPFIIRGSAENE